MPGILPSSYPAQLSSYFQGVCAYTLACFFSTREESIKTIAFGALSSLSVCFVIATFLLLPVFLSIPLSSCSCLLAAVFFKMMRNPEKELHYQIHKDRFLPPIKIKNITEQVEDLYQKAIQGTLFLDSSLPQQAHDRLAKFATLTKRFNGFSPEVEGMIKDLLFGPEIIEAREALKQGKLPMSPQKGKSGAFLLPGKKGTVGIFKLKKREPPVKKKLGFTANTAHLREEFASKALDGVPRTTVVKFPGKYFGGNPQDTVCGSFQVWVEGACDLKDYEDKNDIPQDEVHSFAIQDILCLNADRHLRNVLVNKGTLVPIDNSYLFGNGSMLFFGWNKLPQAKKPFSKELLGEIAQLDPQKLPNLIRQEGLNTSDGSHAILEQTLHMLVASACLLKIAAKKGLPLSSIAHLYLGKEKSYTTSSYFYSLRGKILHKTPEEMYAIFEKIVDDYLNPANLNISSETHPCEGG